MKTALRLHGLPLATAAMFALGMACGASENPDVGHGSDPAGTPATVAAASNHSVGEEEATAFAEIYETAVWDGDLETAAELIDWDAVFDRATRDVDVAPAFREGFVKGARKEASSGQLITQLAEIVAAGGSFKFLRLHTVDGETRALFRLIHPDAGLNYHDMILSEDETGKVQAVDIYVYLSAERFSETIRRLFLLAAAEQPRTIVGRLLRGDSELIKHADEFREFAQRVRTGEFQQAAKIYEALPETIQAEKSAMLLYIQATASLGNDLYARAIESFRAAHPDDPCLDMLLIDGYLLRQEHDKALAAVDRVDQAVGGDPYLDVLRAGIDLDRRHLAAARGSALRAIEREPDLIDGYWTMVSITLAEKNHAQTARWLDRLRDTFGVEFVDLTTVPEYADFVASPEYRDWLQRSPR